MGPRANQTWTSARQWLKFGSTKRGSCDGTPRRRKGSPSGDWIDGAPPPDSQVTLWIHLDQATPFRDLVALIDRATALGIRFSHFALSTEASHANTVAFELPVIWGLSNSDAMTYVPAISIELQDGQVQQTIGRLDIGLNRYESLDGFGDPEALAELFTKHFGTSSVHEMGCALRVSGELPCSQFLPVLRATCDLINLRQFDSL